MNCQCEKDRAEGISLLYPLTLGMTCSRAGEQSALTAVTAVDPWREGRKVDADGAQDGCSVNRFERIGHVNRDVDLTWVRAVAGEPLPSSMDNGFTAIGSLNPQLQRLKGLAGPLGDQVHGYLTGEAADGFSNRDRSQRSVWLAKSHAPHTHGRTSSGTSPLSRRLTTSERSQRSKSEEAGRMGGALAIYLRL